MATKKISSVKTKTKKPVKKVSKPVAKKLAGSTKSVAKKPVKSKKAENKTKPTTASVEDFINSVDNEQKRKDSFTILKMMKKITGEDPQMWGAGLIGFGHTVMTSERSGRTVDWFKMGFSPRKANLTLYLGLDLKAHATDLKKLGKHKTGGGCLYINKLEDVDMDVLEGMIKKAGFKSSM